MAAEVVMLRSLALSATLRAVNVAKPCPQGNRGVGDDAAASPCDASVDLGAGKDCSSSPLPSVTAGAGAEAADPPRSGSTDSDPGTGRLVVLAVNGTADQFFAPELARGQLGALRGSAEVRFQLLPGLDHDSPYDRREMALVVAFLAERLRLAPGASMDQAALERLLPERPQAWARKWAQLSAAERVTAKQLGVFDALGWDLCEAPVWSRTWQELWASQRQAAALLGYTAQLWTSMAH
mmetsp:Transcript_5680/g.17540  ORF Transcript_5680/g.17540 Transcript_5680/m.17540 type:complete len:238 (-) Transcript_5680:482-1195(-)